MSAIEGCPDGMYPLDVDYDESPCETFVELREQAEASSNSLNLPLSWFFSDPEDEDDGRSEFQIVFVMPRKQCRTWSIKTKMFDRDEVQAWLDTWVRQEINTWFGWDTDTAPTTGGGARRTDRDESGRCGEWKKDEYSTPTRCVLSVLHDGSHAYQRVVGGGA